LKLQFLPLKNARATIANDFVTGYVCLTKPRRHAVDKTLKSYPINQAKTSPYALGTQGFVSLTLIAAQLVGRTPLTRKLFIKSNGETSYVVGWMLVPSSRMFEPPLL
jgi:hypothetical protein